MEDRVPFLTRVEALQPFIYPSILSTSVYFRAAESLFAGLLQKAALWPMALWLYGLVALELGDHENVME